MINHKQTDRNHSRKRKKRADIDLNYFQKAHQEVPQEKSKIENPNRKQELLDETQNFMYQQSGKFSSVSRNLVLGIIGTIWFLTYVNGKLTIPNTWLFCCLLSGLLFLLTDVIHYFWDSMSYHKELYNLEKYNTQKEFDDYHEPKMDWINKRSHRFIVAKFWMLMIASVLFGIGIVATLV